LLKFVTSSTNADANINHATNVCLMKVNEIALYTIMKNFGLPFLILLSMGYRLYAQPCSVAQTLSSQQQAQISSLISPLDTALKYENLFQIDSLSNILKNVYAAQAGIPDAIENYYTLSANTNWLSMNNALLLSRALIDADSLVYVNLWKAAKGMNPPAYQPHSLFLRAPAEIAAGLLKIANYETDLNRKTLYQSWAKSALDSLATVTRVLLILTFKTLNKNEVSKKLYMQTS